jgi:amino acid transporter
MNIKKGMERIVLIIAIVAIVPGFILGGTFVLSTCKTETPEHKAWQKKVDGWYEANPDWNKEVARGIETWIPFLDGTPTEEWKEPLPTHKDPPIWQVLLGCVVAAPLSFFIVLFGIRGTTWFVMWLVMWVVAGFRDKDEEV